jgi:O-antigen/teichoic acid export membrane protein
VEFENETQQLVIILLLFAAVFEKFYGFSSATFTATMEQARANLPFFVKSIAWQIGRIIVVLLGFKAIGLATWNLVITLLVLPLVYNLIKKYPGTEWDHELFKRYVGYAVPIFLVIAINSVIQYSDKLFLAHYTDTTELGYFSAANSIGGMVMMVSVAAGNIFFPLFSSYLKTNNWEAIRGKIMQYQEFLAIFAFPLVCLIAVVSTPLLVFVLGARYEPSILPFAIIVFATYVSVVGMPYGNTITGAGRFYLNVLINLIKMVVFVISINIFISPRFLGLGATGLALNLLAINLATNLLYLYFSKRLSHLSFLSIQNTFRYLLIFSVSGALYLYQDTFSDWFAFWWIAIIPVYLIFVYGLMYLLGLVKITHARQLMDLVNVSKVLAYVKGELGDNNK